MCVTIAQPHKLCKKGYRNHVNWNHYVYPLPARTKYEYVVQNHMCKVQV